MNLFRNFIMTKISGKKSVKVKGKNLEKARRGEDIARRYLCGKGYRIIEQNYRTRYAEIDLIAEHKGTLVFVEVRSRRDERFGRPEETINRKKINKLIRNARGYMARRASSKMCRIDAICIVLGEGKKPKRIDHYKNIAFHFKNK